MSKCDEMLEFIRAHIAEHGYPPSVREIGQAVGIKSKSTVHQHLVMLQRDGRIERDPRVQRGIRVVGR